MIVGLIAALDENRAIGFDNQMPWHLPDDLKYFKHATQGGVVVMGRKTFESIGSRPLPNRRNIVLTRQQNWQATGVEVSHDWTELYQGLQSEGLEKVWVIGGGELYTTCMPEATELLLTRVAVRLPSADAWFPIWESEQWQLMETKMHSMDEKHLYAFNWQRWQKNS